MVRRVDVVLEDILAEIALIEDTYFTLDERRILCDGAIVNP